MKVFYEEHELQRMRLVGFDSAYIASIYFNPFGHHVQRTCHENLPPHQGERLLLPLSHYSLDHL